MRRIIVSVFMALALFLPLYAVDTADVYSYSGATATYSSASAAFRAEISSSTWLKTSSSSSSQSFLYYGFSTDSAKGTLTPDEDNSNTPTLFFKEELIEKSTGDYYQGSAKFTLFFYIISNSSFKATLSWSNLTQSSDSSADTSLAVTMNGDSSRKLVITADDGGTLFDPADGISQKIEKTIEAKTEEYSLDYVENKVVYTGWMKLTLESA